MKKLTTLLLVLLMVITMIGCTGKVPDTSPEVSPEASPTTNESTPETEETSKGTIKIGFLGSLSGNAAVMGQDAKAALELYCKMNNYNLGGYKTELYIEDDEDNASTAVTKCTKLVENYGVDIIIGPQNAGSALGIADYLIANEVPLIMYHAPVDALTKTKANDFMVRTQLSASQGSHAMGEYAYKTLGLKTAALFSYDFTFGYQLAGGFQKVFEENGGKVISKQFTPIGTTDFAPMLANIDWDSIDVLAYHFSGGDGSRFCQAIVDMGLTKKKDLTIICLQNGVDELYLKDLPLELADVPFYSVAQWAMDCDNDANREFVKLYQQGNGHDPSCHAENTFAAMTSLKAVLESGVDPTDGAKLVAAIRAQKNIEVPRGQIYSFDQYGQAVTDVCIRKLILKDGTLYNALEYVYPEVSQFWTYSAEEFMSWPEYSADYPPVK